MRKNYFNKLKECSGNSDIVFHFLNLFSVWLNRRLDSHIHFAVNLLLYHMSGSLWKAPYTCEN